MTTTISKYDRGLIFRVLDALTAIVRIETQAGRREVSKSETVDKVLMILETEDADRAQEVGRFVAEIRSQDDKIAGATLRIPAECPRCSALLYLVAGDDGIIVLEQSCECQLTVADQRQLRSDAQFADALPGRAKKDPGEGPRGR